MSLTELLTKIAFVTNLSREFSARNAESVVIRDINVTAALKLSHQSDGAKRS